MDFYAEELEDFPNVAYIAIVGPFERKIADELLKRAQRIEEASPAKDTLVLDVRGLTGLETEHYEPLRDLKNKLNELDWNLYFCNVPSRFQNFFQSRRVQRTFEIFESKSDLIDFLEDGREDEENGDTEEEESNFEPVPVVLRTSSGVRLLEATANELTGTTLTLYTTDHNAKTIKENDNLDLNLYFDTDRFQVVPSSISLENLESIEHDHWNYRIVVQLDGLDELDFEQIEEYFDQKSETV